MYGVISPHIVIWLLILFGYYICILKFKFLCDKIYWCFIVSEFYVICKKANLIPT